MNTDKEGLIRNYLDGAASAEESREVDRLVQTDPGFRRELLSEAAVDARLGAALVWPGEIARSRQQVLRPVFLRTVLTAAAAVLVLGFGLVWYIATMKPITIVVMRSPERVEKIAASGAIPMPPAPELLGRITRVQGTVLESGPDARERGTMQENNPVVAGCTIEVGKEGQAEVEYVDGTRIVLYKNTTLAFDPSSGGKLLHLTKGAVDSSVVPQPAGEPLKLYTEGMTIEVRGTEFRTIADSNTTWMAVRSGTVCAYRHKDGRTAIVPAGGYVTLKKGMPFSAMPAKTCPLWQGASKAAAGGRYP